ncbi:MAG: hypothetical protein ACP5NQ_01420 [Vulcanisaeta sp.]
MVIGYAYISEELKTITLRRSKTTTTCIKKALNSIVQGVLDALMY